MLFLSNVTDTGINTGIIEEGHAYLAQGIFVTMYKMYVWQGKVKD